MGKRSRTATVVVALLVVAVAVVVSAAVLRQQAPASKPALRPDITLSVKARQPVGAPVRLTGTLRDVGSGTAVLLQRKSDRRWVTVDRQGGRGDGAYAFVRMFDRPARGVFRTVAVRAGRTLDTSAARAVTASAPRPDGSALPVDLGAKKLTDCAASEQPCFTITSDAGRRHLRFPFVTVNTGPGPLEIRGYRSSRSSDDWIAALTTHYTSGDTSSRRLPGIVFYFAEDGHNHWHIRDFDYYQVLDSSGKVLRRGEKHGFCFEDNTAFRDWAQQPDEHPGVPQRPVYKHETSCGEERPYTTSMVHGLSVGWADTYPTSLPDQNIDITGLPDGVYTVRVQVDGQHLVPESNEQNNSATVKIRIRGSRVVVDASTATGL